MMNNALINMSVALATNYLKNNEIEFNEQAIKQRVENWYCHSDIADAEILAACAIASDYEPWDYEHILETKEYYFPTIPVEFDNISIEEIELAMKY